MDKTLSNDTKVNALMTLTVTFIKKMSVIDFAVAEGNHILHKHL